MSITSELFPVIAISDAEQAELKRIFSQDVVVKYLRALGREDSRDLLDLSALDLPAEAIANRHILITGKLQVVATLLSISSS